MSRWVNLDVRLPGHTKTFLVPLRCLRSMVVLEVIRNAPPDLTADGYDNVLDDIADQCRKIVLEHRPELTACEILYIGYELDVQALAITVQHPSLPRVAMYDSSPRTKTATSSGSTTTARSLVRR